MEYTKGEWKAVKNAVGVYTIQTEDTRIGEIDRHFNAHLIAAAPDMYEALKGIIARRMESHETEAAYIPSEIEAVYKALAKAEGGGG